MKSKQVCLMVLVVGILAAVVGCGGGEGDPAAVVERYMAAKAAADGDVVRELLCSEMESVLEREQTTFAGLSGVETRGITCERVPNQDVVTCDGEIVALYGAEENAFPLTMYRVVQEDGAWRWCGETN